jgi:hypothetical protein
MAKRNSMIKSSRKNQKIYKMKGCSKKTLKNKKHLGGSSGAADVNLAYTGKTVQTVPNPFLAYTGKGGTSCSSNLTPSLAIPVNTNAVDRSLPNTGPVSLGGLGTPFLNPQGAQRGGCGCGMPLLSGGAKRGGCGPSCMVGGKHRVGCKCSSCKMKGGNKGIPYPDGLVGAPMTSQPSGWPGVDGVQGGRNYIAPNNYHTDVQTAIISTGAQPPFSIGGSRKSRKQKGGTLSNFMAQDLINLGRQFSFGLGSAYNALTGYAPPTNPMPWKDQLPNTPNLATMQLATK